MLAQIIRIERGTNLEFFIVEWASYIYVEGTLSFFTQDRYLHLQPTYNVDSDVLGLLDRYHSNLFILRFLLVLLYFPILYNIL